MLEEASDHARKYGVLAMAVDAPAAPLSNGKILPNGSPGWVTWTKRRRAAIFFRAIPPPMTLVLPRSCMPKCCVSPMSTCSAPNGWPRRSEWLAEVLHNDAARAFSLRARGHVHFAQGQHPNALESYGAAIALLERLGQDLDVGRTLTSGLQALIYLGRYDQAFQWAERARAIFDRHGDQLRLARLSSNMGNILYRQDRHVEALEYYNQAAGTARPVGGAARSGRSPQQHGGVLHQLGTVSRTLSHITKPRANIRCATTAAVGSCRRL